MIRFALFIVVPLAEMALLVLSAEVIGFLWTLAVVIATGIVGAALVKRQGLAVWSSARQRLSQGSLPTTELAHGAMLLVAGAFLLTPGFLTDLTGFALLAPPVREWIRRRFGNRFINRYSTTTRVEVWR